MIRFAPAYTASALALTLASPAAADLTAQQVWDSWKNLGANMGQSITVGTETMTNGILSLNDVAIAMDVPDGQFTSTLSNITLAPQDGTVLITMSPQYDMRVKLDPEDDEAVDMTLQLVTPGLQTTASGSLENIRYDFTAPEIAMSIVEMMVDGKPVDMDLDVAVNGLAGHYLIDSSEGFGFESVVDIATLIVDMEGRDLETPGSGVSLKAAYQDIRAENSGQGAGLSNMADPAALFAPDTVLESGYTHNGGSFTLDVSDPEEGSFTFASTTAAGSLDAVIVDGTMMYAGESQSLDLTVSGAAIPFPELSATLDEFGFALEMPVVKTDAPADFGLTLILDGLSVSDVLWSMIDPSGALPRDPATLLVDLGGQATMLVDPTDPAALDTDAAPGELHALKLDALRLSIAGAELTGEGGFTFDNSDLVTFDGFPAPDGEINLKLVGGNTLLDKLVQMGLLPQDQAMGARMMMGLFAVPSGDDTLTSKIQVTPDGAISANGQRLQ
ncbi:DUF2125 domain-containing protein [Oceaniglobus ichthyenteri]|uniref:DUF2125 domain-containing protein n=1 Tax=Oceaniglobus ichthyenteri TaxID=2136177 RepID=UPI0013DE458A|nr:DUF2125 domain-containing protein [Oceaniglobus ichthyenteri]